MIQSSHLLRAICLSLLLSFSIPHISRSNVSSEGGQSINSSLTQAQKVNVEKHFGNLKSHNVMVKGKVYVKETESVSPAFEWLQDDMQYQFNADIVNKAQVSVAKDERVELVKGKLSQPCGCSYCGAPGPQHGRVKCWGCDETFAECMGGSTPPITCPNNNQCDHCGEEGDDHEMTSCTKQTPEGTCGRSYPKCPSLNKCLYCDY